MRVYLIAPSPDFGNAALTGDSSIGVSTPYALIAAAGIATVAAFFPPEVELRLCDEIIESVDYDDPAEVVAISVNVSQAARGVAIARRFREKGRTVVLGGAHVSLAPHLFEGHADCLVVGEFEPLAAEFMADLKAGALKARYQGGRADMTTSPMPRWDLYRNDRALAGVVQTSRGCPFECNFCDVIQYLGRAQRHKPVDQVLAEVEVLYKLGYRDINLSDDNFTVYRNRTRELLAALGAWNGAQGREPMRFNTQMSIDIARDPDILSACNSAGLRYALVGIETNNPGALKESKKRQNLNVDLVAQCQKIVSMGVSIQASFMVGFDSDDLSCFEAQFEFAMSLPVVSTRVSMLVAPVATPLFEKMRVGGRIVQDPGLVLSTVGASLTNIQPSQMTREQLKEGANWLNLALLKPENVTKRLEHYARLLGPAPAHLVLEGTGASQRAAPFLELMSHLARDRGARQVMDCVSDLSRQRPEIRRDLSQMLGLYLNNYMNMYKGAQHENLSWKVPPKLDLVDHGVSD